MTTKREWVDLHVLLSRVGRLANRMRLTEDEEQCAKTFAWMRWRRHDGRVCIGFCAKMCCLRALRGDDVPGIRTHSQQKDVMGEATRHAEWVVLSASRPNDNPARIALANDLYRELFRRLDARERRILARLATGATQEEAGAPEGLGKRRVSQLVAEWRLIVNYLCR
jgi:hypothetical protein